MDISTPSVFFSCKLLELTLPLPCLSGPFDVVMMDMTCTRLLKSVTECRAGEAQRLVFMGWPGQNELEAASSGGIAGVGDGSGLASRVASEGYLLSFDIRNRATTAAVAASLPSDATAVVSGRALPATAAAAAGRPTKAVDELLDEPHSRQLG